MTTTPSAHEATGDVVLGGALILLAVSGAVLATSWFVPFPAPVLIAAWLAAGVAVAGAAVAGWRAARRQGQGLLASARASLAAIGRFVVRFF